MRRYWILPNRAQGDAVLASDGQTTFPLRQILDPETRPDGFAHGVPTEVLERCATRGFADALFAQRFPRWSDDTELRSVFAPAGVDASGRTVHLGLLFLLTPGEEADFELSSTGLPEVDRPHAAALIRRMTAPKGGDPWADSVHELFDLSALPGPATNVELARSVAPFHALYAVSGGRLTRLAAGRPLSLTATIVLSTIVALVGLYLSGSARHCAETPKHADQISWTMAGSGESTWRFS